jgi:hypothetical protein
MSRRRRTKNNTNSSSGLKASVPNHKYGLIPVNNLTYGNPNAEQNMLIQRSGEFDYIASYFMDKPYPNNDGEYAKKEIQEIQQEMKNLQFEKVVELSIKFDEDVGGMMIDTAVKCGVPKPGKFVKELLHDIDGIIMKLKFYYNRIRPYQLANVYSIPLNPMPSPSSHSPSYPSGHTIQSRVFADVLSYRYPQHYDMLDKFAEKCNKSRVILGLHFPSDGIFGFQVATGIVRDENFKKKYFSAQKVSEAQNQNLAPGLEPDFAQHKSNQSGESVFGGLPQQPGQDLQVPGEDNSGVFGGLPTPPQGNPMQHIKR